METETIYEDLKYYDLSELKYFIFGLITYKHISQRIESHLNKELFYDKMTYEEAWEIEEYKDDLKEESIDTVGFFLKPQILFKNIQNKSETDDFILENMERVKREFYIGTGEKRINILNDIDFKSLRKIHYDIISYDDLKKGIRRLLSLIDDWTEYNNTKDLFNFFLRWFNHIGSEENRKKINGFEEFGYICSHIFRIVHLEEKNIHYVKTSIFLVNETLYEIYENLDNYALEGKFDPFIKRIIIMYIIVNYI